MEILKAMNCELNIETAFLSTARNGTYIIAEKDKLSSKDQEVIKIQNVHIVYSDNYVSVRAYMYIGGERTCIDMRVQNIIVLQNKDDNQ